jgi:hypothetical protein
VRGLAIGVGTGGRGSERGAREGVRISRLVAAPHEHACNKYIYSKRVRVLAALVYIYTHINIYEGLSLSLSLSL